MLSKIKLLLLVSFLIGFIQLKANTINSDSTIVSHIETNSNGDIKIILPSALLERLKINEENNKPSETEVNGIRTGVGYRVQVFTDNNHKTARNEALIKERNIESRFPSQRTYLSYKAPSWRLRVGDFKTHEEARELLIQIKNAFPGYAKEATIVLDRINLH